MLRPPSRLIKTAYAFIQEAYHKNFREESDNTTNKIIEYTYSMRKALLFQKAMVLRPEHEMKAPERGGNQGDKD